MKWKNKAVTKITGISLSSSFRELAMAINHNAKVLRGSAEDRRIER